MINKTKKIGFVPTSSTIAAVTMTVAIAFATTAGAGDKPTRDDLTPKDLKRVLGVTKPTDDFTKAEQFEAMAGGAATTTREPSRNSFSQFSANLKFDEEERFKLGNALFNKLWVSSPSSTHSSDGLGPLFNARSCESCHLKDGRGHPIDANGDTTSMFLRLARPGAETVDMDIEALKAYLAQSRADPVYGGQLQDRALPGIPGEGRVVVDYAEIPVTLGDGTVVHLRKPEYSVADPGYGPLDSDTTLSPRIAPPMIGVGQVEAIHDADILSGADPHDADGDGISGRPGYALDPQTGDIVLARFGWKAATPSVRAQSAGAFSGDMGISTPDKPNANGDCTENQAECLAMPSGVQKERGDTEAPGPILDLVTFYSQNLAVPARRNVDDPDVLAGKELFYAAGCTGCHTPKFVTSRKAEIHAQAFQLIWPYSDFLLHDMGDGLADGQNEGVANGVEWRTAPLWGIGLTETVSGHTFFLHDGRARNLTEAILWHGGEAQEARDAFAALEADDRAKLIRFLESL